MVSQEFTLKRAPFVLSHVDTNYMKSTRFGGLGRQPKLEAPFWGLHHKDHGIWGSLLEVPYLWKAPHTFGIWII